MLANNNYSFICFNQIGYIKIKNNEITFSYPGEAVTSKQLSKNEKVSDVIHQYLDRFETSKSDFKFLNNGLFGFMSHESVKYFDSINIENKDDFDIPDIYYGLYQNIIAISQYNHEAHIFCNTIDNSSNLESIEAILNNKSYSVFSFKKDGQPESTITDNEYLDYVKKAKDHCKRGDVFQLVLSRRFMQKFSGDEFNVYRALRSINPSPYLFFFDYGDYKIFGSSPEAQIIIKDGKSEIHPIAGTFKRTGNDEEDHITATELAKDPKENSEHIMLVDLARNDLSRSGNNVKVGKKQRDTILFSCYSFSIKGYRNLKEKY
jgi:anthranilate synthase component 1